MSIFSAETIKAVPDEIIDLLNEVQGKVNYSQYNLPTPKGFLLVGPPGTGKTALVRALAEESGFDFVATKGSDFTSYLIGSGAEAVRGKFAEARSKLESICNAPATATTSRSCCVIM